MAHTHRQHHTDPKKHVEDFVLGTYKVSAFECDECQTSNVDARCRQCGTLVIISETPGERCPACGNGNWEFQG